VTDAMLEEASVPLSLSAAEAYVASTCFKTGPPRQIGIELEFVVAQDHDWSAPLDFHQVHHLLQSLPPLPAGGTLSREPGGQVELSTQVAPDLPSVLAAATTDVAALRGAFAAHRLVLAGVGLDPHRQPVRVLDQPRYAAMERHLDRWGTGGRTMMCSTAAVQTTVEAAHVGRFGDGGLAARWTLLHAIAPALIAAFANSPYSGGKPSSWKSGRQAAWRSIDPSRTRAAQNARAAADPRETYARFALDAQVMLVRRAGRDWSVAHAFSFRDWILGRAGDLAPPTVDDLAYHLTTLFPPVRARGPLELRCIDAQQGDHWRVPPAVVSALLDDPAAGDKAREAVEPVVDHWEKAARDAVGDPDLQAAATACLLAAADGLRRQGNPDLAREVDDFTETYTWRGRCPADDLLDSPPWPRSIVLTEPEILETTSC
jgi:glutamate--cysteine ligase